MMLDAIFLVYNLPLRLPVSRCRTAFVTLHEDDERVVVEAGRRCGMFVLDAQYACQQLHDLVQAVMVV